jgi:Holliday junction resolvasome RuvABC endonuclease subunit
MRIPKRPELNADERRHALFTSARQAFALLPAGTLLVCEEPITGKSGKTTRLLGLAAGAIWAAHLDFQIFWAWGDIAAWKKLIVGNGNADKAAIADWCRAQGVDYPESEPDYFDAHCLSLYANKCVTS